MDGEKPKIKINPAFLNRINQQQNTGASASLSELYKSKTTNQKLGNNALNNLENKNKLVDRFKLNKDNYYLLKEQAGNRLSKFSNKMEIMTLNLEESASLMVGSTAETISFLSGEEGAPAADEVIYLDKSARPVSWLVDEFWGDFTDAEKPNSSYLAIDRRTWFPYVGVELIGNEEIRDPDGTIHAATGEVFWEHFNRLPENTQKEYLAKIRCLYIDGGITEEDPDKIMNTPSRLDGKNITIIDEVARSGSTMEIATGLIARAFNAKSVNGHVFWADEFKKTDKGETQMGAAPFWYPQDSNIWYGRGVKDIDVEFYRSIFENNPTPENRAKAYGAFVLGIPLNPQELEEEPGRVSTKVRDDIEQLHKDYVEGHVLPQTGNIEPDSQVYKRITGKMEELGVEYAPIEEAKNKYNSYGYLIKQMSTN